MAFEWKDYIDLAQFLQQEASGKTNGEAYLRSAISRTYYGVMFATTPRRSWGFRRKAKRRIMGRCVPASELEKPKGFPIGWIGCGNGETIATT